MKITTYIPQAIIRSYAHSFGMSDDHNDLKKKARDSGVALAPGAHRAGGNSDPNHSRSSESTASGAEPSSSPQAKAKKKNDKSTKGNYKSDIPNMGMFAASGSGEHDTTSSSGGARRSRRTTTDDDDDNRTEAESADPVSIGAFPVGGRGGATSPQIDIENVQRDEHTADQSNLGIPLAAEVANDDDKPFAEASAVESRSWISKPKNQAIAAVILLLVIGIIVAIVIPMTSNGNDSKNSDRLETDPSSQEGNPADATSSQPVSVEVSSSAPTTLPPTEPTKTPTSAPTIVLESCDSNSDCVNGSCGLEDWSSFAVSAGYVCCPDGSPTVEALKPGSSFIDDIFCSELPAGEPCGINNMCASGTCVNNVCS